MSKNRVRTLPRRRVKKYLVNKQATFSVQPEKLTESCENVTKEIRFSQKEGDQANNLPVFRRYSPKSPLHPSALKLKKRETCSADNSNSPNSSGESETDSDWEMTSESEVNNPEIKEKLTKMTEDFQ